MKTKLSIVVPSYNETIELKRKAIEDIDSYLKKQDYTYEVLIVDDGSTNDSVPVVKEYIKNKKNFKLIENPHGGKALTVMSGMLLAEGEIALFTDMDQATPIDQIEKFIPKFEEGYDIVIGARKGRKGAPLIRKIAAWGFATLRNLILGLPFSDTQCGFKVFNKQARDEVFSKLKTEWSKAKAKGAAVNAGFDVETLFLAKKKGFKIADVEVNWHHVQNEKQVQIVRDSIEALKDMLRIRLNDIQGKYGKSN
jgi:dolichyl-phosphate beta-glucosyltransferase